MNYDEPPIIKLVMPLTQIFITVFTHTFSSADLSNLFKFSSFLFLIKEILSENLALFPFDFALFDLSEKKVINNLSIIKK